MRSARKIRGSFIVKNAPSNGATITHDNHGMECCWMERSKKDLSVCKISTPLDYPNYSIYGPKV